MYIVGNICVSPFSDITLIYKLAHIFHVFCSPHISIIFTVGRVCHYQLQMVTRTILCIREILSEEQLGEVSA